MVIEKKGSFQFFSKESAFLENLGIEYQNKTRFF